jgi:L-iditol 2-dehydrogenase
MPFVLPGVVKIPARNSFTEGAMLEPVNTVLKAIKRLALLRGDTVLVAGQGPIGLMFTRLLALGGISVVATDLLQTRLGLAGEFGAKQVFQVKAGQPSVPEPADGVSARAGVNGRRSRRTKDHDLPSLVERMTGGRGLDAAVIAVPSAAVVREAQGLVRGGGQVLLFSHTKRGEQADLDLATICVDEKDLIGSYSADFTLQAEVARLIFSRRMDVRRLVTHEFPLERTGAAVELAAHPSAESLKVVVNHQAVPSAGEGAGRSTVAPRS